MGYNVHLESRESKFRIPADKVEECLNGILDNPKYQNEVKDAKKHVKYFDYIPAQPKLIELIYNAWGFRLTPNTVNDLDKISYEWEKMHDFDGFCNAVAPCVESGSYIQFCGEDGEKWRYAFRDGKWKEIRPVLTWPD